MTALGVDLPPARRETDGPLGHVLLGHRTGSATAAGRPDWAITVADAPGLVDAYRGLRRDVFVAEQGLFSTTDLDERDEDPRTVVLVARAGDGTVLGGVRLGPAIAGPDLGWWQGGRLAVSRAARRTAVAGGVGAALVRAACAVALDHGVVRFEATVQLDNETFFRRLGWITIRPTTVAGVEHVLMRWPIDRFGALVRSTKSALGPLLAGLQPGGQGYVGDDGAPVPGSDVIAACDAILPSMVERDPEWAGWCSVLVNLNDLAAMGAHPVGLLDALGSRDASFAARVLSGLRRASVAYGVPVLGGHTQLGVPASLSVTALGRTSRPVPGGGGRPGHAVTLTADLGGCWRPGYSGKQWDSTTHRTPTELQALLGTVPRMNPRAAKDVSMAGIVGTLGMLAEASSCGAVLDVADMPRPEAATVGDWLTCFPGFAMLTTDESRPDRARTTTDNHPATSGICGELVVGAGVRLRWPDGELTEALGGEVTGLGPAGAPSPIDLQSLADEGENPCAH